MESLFKIGLSQETDSRYIYVDPQYLRGNVDVYESLLLSHELGFEPGLIQVSSGQSQASLEDTWPYLILGLCFQSIIPLIRGEPFEYQYFDDSAMWALLEPKGDQVHLTGSEVLTCSFPRYSLAQSLFICGQNAHAEMLALNSDYAGYIQGHGHFESQAAQVLER